MSLGVTKGGGVVMGAGPLTTYHYACGCLVVGDVQQRLRYRTPCSNTAHAPIEPGSPGYSTIHDTAKHDCFDRRCELKERARP